MEGKPLKSKVILKRIFDNYELTLLALPALVYVFIFAYIPLYGLILPFKEYKYDLGFFKSPWVGLNNFKFLFNSDSIWTITRNTIGMNALFILFGTIISVLLSLFLFELSRKLVKIYQTIMFFPYFLSWVVASYVFLGFFDMDNGVINKFLIAIGKDPIMWYSEPKFWPIILVLASIWKGAGYSAVIYYTGLLGIDPEYYEASIIDGANKVQQIFYISLPLIKPIIILLTILSIGRIFYGDFGLFYNVTLNSPQLYPVTDIIDTYVYRTLKSIGDIGMSSAAGFYQAVVGFILVIVTNWIIRKTSSENALF